MLHKRFPVSSIARHALARVVAICLLGSVTSVYGQTLSEARDLVESRRFYAAATALNALVEAQSLSAAELAQAYTLRGESQRQRNRFAEARADFQRAFELDASLGAAAFGLGLAERYGWGGAPNSARAQELLRQAADTGIAQAAMELASLYLSAAPADVQQGLVALQQAAGLGQRDASFTLGELYRVGQFVRADLQEAFRWYLQAADLGHPAAMFRVSMAYREGSGITAEASAAETWLARSLDQGYREALQFAGFGFESQGDLILANQHYWRAAQAGLIPAQINLGVSYMMGDRGLQQDFGKAYYWFNRAANAPLADYYRGRLLEHGRGVEANPPAAYAAYEGAARASLPEAMAYAALFLDLGRGVNANPDRAAAYFSEFASYTSANDLNSVAWAIATHPAATVTHARLALELANRATAMTPDPSSMDTLAAAYAASGDFEQAVSIQEQATQAVTGASLAPVFEAHLTKYREGQRWIDDLPAVSSANGATASYPEETIVFTGEVVGLTQGAPGNTAASVELDPGDSEWGVVVRVGRVEQGELPQHLQDSAVFYLHSPTELFAGLPVRVPVMSSPQGEYRFTLIMKDLDFDLTMEVTTPL